ncbi:DUF4342 domain-containing protein [Clostridium tunisiense]|uniref:DUF4342 domain-containing protein n=1 Tax=Clostridium tunisiense TaxID=219748 RepID=UPI0002D7D947|nr:DUF4342 domain-containing protein [Clostridium tunisiense]
MTVRLENIDEVRRRANVSYEDAKAALEMCNDDIVEALVYLEREKKFKTSAQYEERPSLWDKFKALVKKGNNTSFIIRKRENTIFSMPVTAAVIITIIAPYLTVIGVLSAFFTGHRVKFQGKNGDCTGVNSVFDKVANTVDNVKKDFSENKAATPENGNENNI